MRILTKDNYVDFEVPIYMSENQRKMFVEGMKKIFPDRIEIQSIVEGKKKMGKIKRHFKKFSEEDQILLANPSLSNDELAKKMGKSGFAIQMKRGPFLMELQEWAKKKGKTKITEKDIQEFLEDEK